MEEGNDRVVGNWLEGYLKYTEESESPDNYHIWSGLSAIASVAKRNVWLDQGIYLLFPNLYAALVGPPGRTAKSTAIRMSRRLISQIPNVVIGPDACSREQLIHAMATSKLNNQCCMTIHSTEFSSIIDTSGILMIQFLTDIYDCDYNNPRGWRYETKGKGKDEIVNPYLNMLVGTTPTYFATAMPDNVLGHGFTSRLICIYEDKERKENSRPKEADAALVKALVTDLQTIAGLHGQFQWTEDGIEAYDIFYHKLYTDIPTDHRVEGYHWRKKIHVLKVAMLLSMAERNDLLLDAKVINAAAAFLNNLEANMGRTFSAVGKYEHATDLERIGSQILASGSAGIALAEIFKRNYFSGSEQELRSMISSLTSMGAVKLVNQGGKEWLKPAGDSLPWR